MGKDQEFLEAARNGNISLVEKILNQKSKRSGPLASLRRGPGINVQDNGGYSALHYSALNGHIEIVRLLLYHEASPNLLDSRGSSALHLAAWAGHQEIVKMLLTHPYRPANPNLQTMENETPLHCAAQHGHTGALTTLLAHGADPNVCNSRNETPLDLAAQYGRLQVVQMLIRAHPELLHPYSVESQSSNNTSIHCKPIPGPFVCHSALHLASRNGHNNIVEILLAAGVNVNLLTPSGTALHEAALCGKEQVVRTLLEAGANLNATNSAGRTPLDILEEFPPHVTKGIISVINNFQISYNDRLSRRSSTAETVNVSDKKSGEESRLKDQINSTKSMAISPSISINSIEPSMTSSTSTAGIAAGDQVSNGYPTSDFYIKMEPIKMQKPAPKKPPRRNLSISPTHTQHFFPYNDFVNTGIEPCANEEEKMTEPSIILQKQGSYEYICTTSSSPLGYSSKEKAITHFSNDFKYNVAPRRDTKPTPVPRKLKNLSSSETLMLKSYNPNRKLKRNRENYFGRGQFSLTISSYGEQRLPLGQTTTKSSQSNYEKSNSNSRRPLSQEYAFASEFVPQGVNMESIESPQEHHTVCLSLCNSSGSLSSGVSLSDRSVSTECVEEFVGDEPFAGLFKGSTMNLNSEHLNDRSCFLKGNHPIRTQSPLEGETQPNSPAKGSQAGSISKEDSTNETTRKPNQTNAYKNNFTLLSNNSEGTTIHEYDGIGEEFSFAGTKVSAHKSENVEVSRSLSEKNAWEKFTEIMETFGSTTFDSESNLSELNSYSDLGEVDPNEDYKKLTNLLQANDLEHLNRVLYLNGYDSYRFINGIFDDNDLSILNISAIDEKNLLQFIKKLPHVKFISLAIESSLDTWLKSIGLIDYKDNFKKHLYNTLKSVCGVWEIELQTILEINKVGHRKRILYSVTHIRQAIDLSKSSDNVDYRKCATEPNSKGTLRQNKKHRPAPKPPLSNLEIRAPSELLIGLPSNLFIKWPHTASSFISNCIKYKVYYLGSTVVKELRGTESTRKSIQKLKHIGRTSNANLESNNFQQEKRSVQLSISFRGVEFIDVETDGTICEHEIRNINCACQDADDMSHFAYITKDSQLNSHYCHVFHVDSMHLAMEIILTLAEAFEVAYQMALKSISPLNNKTTNLSNK